MPYENLYAHLSVQKRDTVALPWVSEPALLPQRHLLGKNEDQTHENSGKSSLDVKLQKFGEVAGLIQGQTRNHDP